MRIIADDKIPFVARAFGRIGETILFPAREITRETLADAEVLLVRSVTAVDGALLGSSAVRFVGTATIGTDHIDIDYLNDRGIALASAPACNSQAVSEYVLAALLDLAEEHQFPLAERTLGVVGAGNIGSKVVRIGQALGMKVLQHDPPLARRTGDPKYLPFDALMSADIITLHLPLIKAGKDTTYHFFDGERMAKLRPGSILINTSRGDVVEPEALKRAIRERHIGSCVLDVWENEPSIDLELLRHANLATPHVAGYSLDGKIRATWMVYQAACHFFGVALSWSMDTELGSYSGRKIVVDGCEEETQKVVSEVVRNCYPIRADDRKLREILAMSAPEGARRFEELRSGYPLRREFSNTVVSMASNDSELGKLLRNLGFDVATDF